jgi:dTDP-4-amino-4,6-dideoxygalactose transaminase
MHHDGVQTSVHYRCVTQFELFAGGPPLPRSEEYCRRELTLPLFPALAESAVEEVVGSLERALSSNRATASARATVAPEGR